MTTKLMMKLWSMVVTAGVIDAVPLRTSVLGESMQMRSRIVWATVFAGSPLTCMAADPSCQMVCTQRARHTHK